MTTDRGGRLLLAGLWVLLLNSAYLAAFASPTLFYFANVVLHMALGLALAIGFAVRAWRGGLDPLVASAGNPRAAAAESPLASAENPPVASAFRRKMNPGYVLALLSGVVLAAGAGAGVLIMIVGAAGTWRWLLPVHIALTIAGLVPLLVYGALVVLRRGGSRERAVAGAACAIAALAAVGAPLAGTGYADRARARYAIRNPAVVPASMNEETPDSKSPFFPSSADTNVHKIIPADFFTTSAACGRCHADIYEQWKSSMHHFSSFNNQWYRKSIEYMQDVVGTKPSKWCAGCHDHAVFFNGRFDRPIKEQIATPEAQAGLACTSCHSITHVRSTMGQGDFEIEYPPMHDLAASEHPVLRFIHDRLTYIDPQPHREIFLKPFHREQTPEFCSSCHKVHLDVPVNSYRWFRGFNDYDNWQASGVSGEGARSFYYPKKPAKCADCHMPLVDAQDPAAKNGKVRSHRFAAANSAVPFVNGDAAQLKAVQDFLRDGQVSVDVFGIVRTPAGEATAAGRSQSASEPRTASTFAVGEESLNFGAAQNFLAPAAEVLAPLDKMDVAVRRGETVRVEVVVRTRKVGHFFPGGTVDAFDVWVELEAVDEHGRILLQSGAAADEGRGPVDPGAHFYRSLLLDEHGNPINKRNAWSARTVAYVRLIPPGAADTIHYRIQVPDDAGEHIYLKAKVNYRKFAWWNTQFAYAGVRDPAEKHPAVTPSYDDGKFVFTGSTANVSGAMKAIPDIPTTVMAESRAALRVLPRTAALPAASPVVGPSVRERWNDYGIGLLLQGDIKNAEATFLKVTQMEPGYADGWVNVGRARIQEGNMAGAEDVLRKALQVDGELAKTHFFLATALKSLGRYDEAVSHLRTASAKYPRDRVVLNQLGRVLFLKRQFKEAIAELDKVLAIDPEDLQAHYNLMLSHQGLGDSTAAARERVLYERFKADESSQAITGPYRQLHADDNNERQQIHEHLVISRSTASAHKTRAGGPGWKAEATRVKVRATEPIPVMSGFSRTVLIVNLLVVAVAALALGAVTLDGFTMPQATARKAATDPQYTDITAAAGIRFKHNNGAFGKKYLPETLGSGAAFLDADNDGWQDILLVNSRNWPGRAGTPSYPALYHNNHNGTFTDVTRQSGLAIEMYGMGVAAADYDNDGNEDVYLTGLGPNRLFHNAGSGKFVDVTARAGVGDPGFSTSAAWFDYDRDGRLDLFVANYVQWSAETDFFCTLDGKLKSYGTPESYKGRSATLYHNNGDGTFEDVTRKAGLYDPTAKGLGIALIDYNDDGNVDLFLANDTQPNRLYKNNGNGTFTDVGMTAGVAFNEAGVARAGMGVDAADYDGSGRQSLIIGNFSNEMMALYSNEGTGLFIDEAPTSTIGKASLLTLTFSCFFLDYDMDGLLDIFAANGHVADDISAVQPRVKYAEPAHLFRNLGMKKFEEVTARSGAALQQPVVARGAAYGDIDNDGDLDLLISANNGPARLLRNDGGNRNHSVRIRTIGTASNRDAIGARVKLTLDSGAPLNRMVKTGSSYCSQSELSLAFGLGQRTAIKSIEITWPSGRKETITGAHADQSLTIQEGKGIVSAVPLRRGTS